MKKQVVLCEIVPSCSRKNSKYQFYAISDSLARTSLADVPPRERSVGSVISEEEEEREKKKRKRNVHGGKKFDRVSAREWEIPALKDNAVAQKLRKANECG